MMEAQICECRQLGKRVGDELAWVACEGEWENKLIHAAPFHKRSAVEVSDHLFQAFPCNKRKLFGAVNHVVWLLWTVA